MNDIIFTIIATLIVAYLLTCIYGMIKAKHYTTEDIINDFIDDFEFMENADIIKCIRAAETELQQRYLNDRAKAQNK